MSTNELPRWLAMIAALTLPTLHACSGSAYEHIARDSVEHMHQALNIGQFQKIYELSDESYRANLTEQESTAFFRNLSDKLGRIIRKDLFTVNTDYSSSGVTVTLIYKTTFEKGEYSEQFVWRIKDNKARLVQYNQ